MSYRRSVRVALGDVDSAQVIYFPAVYRWHEYNLSDWLAANFRPLREILASGFGAPVVSSSAQYPAPLRQDDTVILESWTADIGRTSFSFKTTILNGGLVAAIVETRHVWVKLSPDGGFKAVPFPPDLATALTDGMAVANPVL